MSKLDDFFSAVQDGVKTLAKGELKNFGDAIKDDAKAFLEANKTDFNKWTKQVANRELSKEEFDDLVAGQIELAEMFALTQAGIPAARLQKLRDALVNLIVDTAFDTFL